MPLLTTPKRRHTATTDVDDVSTETQAAVGPSSPPKASLLSQPKEFAQQQWQKAASLLQSNPTLMTQNILCLALKHRPPVHVVDFMLQLNPKAASIPKSGPTPLQIAVENNCGMDVIKRLVQACPFALVETNGGSTNPLSYAKRFRSNETELIHLLSLPLSFWILSKDAKSDEESNKKKKTFDSHSSAKTKTKDLVASSNKRRSIPTRSLLDLTHQEAPSKSNLSSSDRQELNNIKMLCLTVLKGHKRLLRDMHTNPPRPQLPVTTTLSEIDRRALLDEMERRQEKQFRTQLIALDMKEQAMRAHVRRMERRVIQSVMHNKKEMALLTEDRSQQHVTALQKKLHVVQHQLEKMQGHLLMQQQQHALITQGTTVTVHHSSSPHKTTRHHPMDSPVVFASPFIEEVKDDDDEDVRSLLTEESYLSKKRHTAGRGRSFWLVVARGLFS